MCVRVRCADGWTASGPNGQSLRVNLGSQFLWIEAAASTAAAAAAAGEAGREHQVDGHHFDCGAEEGDVHVAGAQR